ncbi:hypothetical protein C7974DRAFT_177501 [Boeremia exigua]|uniref:uncharacterized protein n=1 Tax=Boeremia exigua TaxID=749465 RepID=UPI001E8CDF6F|nr:uncharacterized protein C7974DRAFT_177501 [Boeremia exigua]KAH6633734.1 hypothetical protein C7974DRAFT_177501 [Boeremia exigua]
MKLSVILLSALSAVALAAPSPTWNKYDKSCAHQKPAGHYSDDYKGCKAYNKDELKYKLKCKWYKPQYKHCKKGKDDKYDDDDDKNDHDDDDYKDDKGHY